MYGNQSSVQERLLACLPYLLPMVQALPFGMNLYKSIPLIGQLVSPLFPLFPLLEGNFLISLAIFFGLLFGVVRNRSISRFIRFNTMQALLMIIGLSLLQILFGVLAPMMRGFPILLQTMASTLFLLAFGISIYAFIQNLQGKYTDVPVLSEAASSQVGY